MIIAKIKDGVSFVKKVKSSNRKVWQEVIYHAANLFGYGVRFSVTYSPNSPKRTVIAFYKNENKQG